MSERILRKTWEAAAYNRETNEWDTTTLHSYENSTSIEDLLVRPAVENEARPIVPITSTQHETVTLLGGDAQFPFADEIAVEQFLALAELSSPDEIVLTGDMTDFPALSKYQQRKEWVGSTQASIDQYYTFLRRLRETAPNAQIAAVHGNHEQRLINTLERHLTEVAGLKRAMGNRALLSVQHLARYDELGIESVDGYPNGTLWLDDTLKVVHGTNTRKGGSNAARYLTTEPESTIYGHTHRMEVAYRTRATRLGHATVSASSPGCLASIDGTVPSFYFTPNADGEVVKKAEDWQQGALLVTRQNNLHDITPVRFGEDGFRFNGVKYQIKPLDDFDKTVEHLKDIDEAGGFDL